MTIEEKKFLEDAETYRLGFCAALRWLDRDARDDAKSDDELDASFDDSYKSDMRVIREARRLAGK